MATWKNLDTLASYSKLAELKGHVNIADAMAGEKGAERVKKYSTPMAAGLTYNYAAKQVDETVLDALAKLADEAELIDKFQELYNGAVINTGEKRMVLHHLARTQLGEDVVVDGVNKREFYVAQQKKAADFANKVHAGEITNENGEKFTTVVQIGIGGSDLGPRALYIALENWAKANNTSKMEAKFISNVDPDDAAAVLASVDLAHALFIVVSKSGTTLETLTNEAFVKNALVKAGLNPSKHMLAVTSETSPLAKSEDYLTAIFMDDYIGGRYSSVSGVGGAILSLAFGPEVFAQILDGAAAEDKLATNKNILENPDMLDALIGVYERNVQGYPATAVLPYSQALSRFPAHLQQCDMESNGKSVNRFGEPVDYVTGPVIFGEPGTNGQHSFYQLLHQGTDIVPLQFIGFKNSQIGTDVVIQDSTSQQKLCANVAAQIVAFACGKADDDRNKNFEGGRPSSIIIGEKLNPKTLGALLAHFENKVMFQGFLWNINSFDQEGVQLGKVLAKRVLALGFILVSAGCAIGIGNVWRFPYVVGENGGGLFVLLYLVFLIAMGLPVLTMELAVGRASRKSAVLGYKALEKPGSKWHLHGWAAIFGCYMLMMYYTTVSGWMITYFYKFLTGEFQAGMDAEAAGAVFSNLLADPLQMSFWMILTVILGFFVCSRGLQNGLEKIKS